MSLSSRAWEKSSQKEPPFDPPEAVRITVELMTSGNRKRKINQYIKEARIGKGRYGEVYLCHVGESLENRERKAAIKIVKRSNPRDKIKLLRRNYQQSETTYGSDRPLNSTENSIRKEISIMKKCRHPNIVRLLEVIDDPQQDKIYMVMEYCSGGPVQWANDSKEPILRLEQTRRIMRDVIVGLEYLHSFGIIHRDIKPSNMLYSKDRSIVKIIDFGVSHYNSRRSMPQFASYSTPEDTSLFPDSDLQKTLGTPNFLAPEVVWFDDTDDTSETDSNRSSVTVAEKPSMPKVRPPITEAIDVWALGVTFYCLLFGHTPFNAPSSPNDNAHHNEWMLYNQICTQDWEVDATMTVDHLATGGRNPKDTSSEGYGAVLLLDSMLQKNPLSRITLTDLKRHPWTLRNIPNPREWLQLTSPCPGPVPSTSKSSFPIVKSVISGDSLILRGRPGPQGQPPKERVLHLADLNAPRLGTQTREDEPWAYESREFLRTLAVGKEVSFASIHSLPSNDDVPRDIGTAEINGLDLASEILKNGWAKLKESKREPTPEDLKRKDLENEAKAAGKGVWNAHGPQARQVYYTMPEDSQAFLAEWKGKSIDAIVEQVRDGSNLRVRLLLPNEDHQLANITLAGVRSPRASSKQGETGEQWGEEAKYFTESRLLQRTVRVQILSLPTPGATPFQTGPNPPAAAPVTVFIGNVLHPAGNVAEHLVATGLARVVDWHAGMLAAGGGMERLRAAEKAAKEKRAYLYANVPAPGISRTASAAGGPPKPFDALVTRVWSGDQISVVDKDGKERRLQLSSTRGAKLSDPRQAFYAQEAKEFLRKRLIGKRVKVAIDFIRPREGDFEERECATIRYGGHNANIAEQLIEKGLAGVVRHKRDDEDRSPDYDKLMAAEQAAVADARGIHSGKEVPAPKQPLNISETSNRATTFVSGFKRLGRIPAIVDYVAAGSRFKLFLPKDNQVLTLVLGGIRAPRTARNPSDKTEPFGNEAQEFATRKYMQRDVEFEVETTDKSGGFIGALYLSKTENAAVELVREGLATVHSMSADNLSWARQLYDAEADAKTEKRNIWKDYDEEAEKQAEVQPESDSAPLKSEYLDIIISDVRPKNGLSFSVQVLNTEGIASLEKLMKEFSLHHSGAVTLPPGFIPKGGDLVSAKFSDGAWYRAKVRRASPVKKEAEVTFIDYGNQDTVSFSNIRPLDPKFRSLPGQAQDARLSFIKLVGEDSEYYDEAIHRFRSLCEGRKLVANIDHKEGSLLHLRLIDPSDPVAVEDPYACINADLVREGLASVDRKGCRYLQSYTPVLKRLQEAVAGAKRDRLGMFELGDVEEDE
ncbi:hypothetical protein P691DRAFT_756827 [Macrolepiota fuliginosa MF-IS2]|uniref:Transcription factor n=1 Tax=Macrolepiota fuliginosa MF-IS2 TaxID=1400762 RepID=A0A9P6C864_9AGAR|nr:hypothetical protein P691DRAFT_756827 [Macrolepiota fuliginosa MF-IS2]